MNQAELVSAIDEFFAVSTYDEREDWLSFLDDMYRSAAQPFFDAAFWDGTWNGLMLDNADEISRVYLVVFPSAGVLDTIIAKEVERGASGAMIFAHHPIDFQESGRGFVHIPVEQLEELQEHQISFYNCHIPLDCHPEVSTGGALASALGLHDLQRFAKYHGGNVGIMGTVPPTTFQKFAERLREVCELPRLRYDQILHNAQPVQKVAIIAGGGGETHFIDEAVAAGADTYVTGHWHLFADHDYAAQQRASFQTYIPDIKINLLGASHYSSEMVVMRDQMKSWFSQEFDLEAVLVPQENPWG